jgi:3-phosphoinositide dependent protein kinase-1
MKESVQGISSTMMEYAIKIMDKHHILKEKKEKSVMMERKILHGLSHPLIVKTYFSFQDSSSLYICLDLCLGGDLLGFINKNRDINEKKGQFGRACDITSTKFYTAEIIEALYYLHENQIIHRDLKPENIMFSADGHIKLIDFGTAWNGKDDDSAELERFVGTAEYVTPELLLIDEEEEEEVDIPVTKACDLWALGCIVYQMLSGKTPFHGETEYLIFENIKAYAKGMQPLTYPDSISDNAKDLISKLLERDCTKRLGSGVDFGGIVLNIKMGYNGLKGHRFFEGIKWNDLINSQPPYIPASPAPFDTEHMCDGASDDWLLEGDIMPIMTKGFGISSPSDKIPRVITDVLNFETFLQAGELQIFCGPISKRRGFFSKRRQLILTDKPRLFYVDSDTMEYKGEIPWTKENPISCIKLNDKVFDVCCSTTGRKYHITDIGDAGADMWIELINSVLQVHNPSGNTSSTSV